MVRGEITVKKGRFWLRLRRLHSPKPLLSSYSSLIPRNDDRSRFATLSPIPSFFSFHHSDTALVIYRSSLRLKLPRTRATLAAQCALSRRSRPQGHASPLILSSSMPLFPFHFSFAFFGPITTKGLYRVVEASSSCTYRKISWTTSIGQFPFSFSFGCAAVSVFPKHVEERDIIIAAVFCFRNDKLRPLLQI